MTGIDFKMMQKKGVVKHLFFASFNFIFMNA